MARPIEAELPIDDWEICEDGRKFRKDWSVRWVQAACSCRGGLHARARTCSASTLASAPLLLAFDARVTYSLQC
eukprot:6206324-Pleurochrysis_carterae.AAC.2